MSVQQVESLWQHRAACRGPNHGIFFPPSQIERRSEKRMREKRAKEICASCPALDACRSWVASLPTGHVSGVIAGEIHKPMYLKKRRHP